MRVAGRGAKMALVNRVYNVLFRRSSAFVLTIAVAAVVFERAFDQGTDALFERLNEGRLWKHIKHKYETSEE